MADINNNFIINAVANLIGFRQTVQSMSEVEAKSRSLSRNLSRDAKFMTGNIKSFTDKSGKEIREMTATFRQGTNTIKTVSRDTGNGFRRISQNVTQVGAEAKKARPLSADLIQSLRRVLIVVPIWATFRLLISSVTRIIRGSIQFLKEWEFQLAQIRLVGSATNAEIEQLSNSLLNLARNLGISNRDLGEGAKLFIQQGRAIEEIIPLLNATGRLSLLTGRSITKSVEDLTAVLKAYNLESSDAISIVDAVTNVMLNNAITAGDLASAYKQVASTASALGISLSGLTGFVTAVVEETRDSGNKVGTAFRTIFTRISSISSEAIQEISKIPLFLDDTGRATTQVTPNLRNLEEVITELSLEFGNLSNAQQVQLATLIGGVRRVNQVIALFNNFNTAIEAQTDALFGLGEADEAVAKLTDTLELRIKSVQNAFDQLVNSVGNTEGFKSFLEGIENSLNSLRSVLAPGLSINVDINEQLNERVDSLNKNLNFVKATLEALSKAESLADIIERRPGDLDKVNVQVQSLVRGINEASEKIGSDLRISTDIASPEELVQAIEENLGALEDIEVQARINIDQQEVRRQLANLGTQLGSVIDGGAIDSFFRQLQTDFGFASKEAKTQFEEAFRTLDRLRLGDIVDENDINRLRDLIRGNIAGFGGLEGDELEGTLTLLGQVQDIQEQINVATQREADIRANFNRSINQLKEGLLTQQQIEDQILNLRRRIASEDVDRLEAIREEVRILTQTNAELSESQQNRLDTLETQEIQISKQRELLRLQIRQESILDELRNSGASNIQIAIQELAFLEQINAQEEQRLGKVKEINSLIATEQQNITEALVSGQAEILRLQGESELNIIKQTFELEKQLGIERQGIDLVKQRLDLAKAITKENQRSREDRLKALREEVREQARAQSPAVQRRLDAQESRLRARAESLGIDADEFLNVPQLEDVRLELNDLPNSFKTAVADPLETSMNRLTGSIEDLTRNLINQQTSGLSQTFTGQEPTVRQDPFVSFNSGTEALSRNPFISPLQQQPALNISVGNQNLDLNLNGLDEEQLRSQLNEKLTERNREFIDEIVAQLRDRSSKIRKATNEAFDEF